MALARYEPWNALTRFHDQLNELFGSRFTATLEEGDIFTSQWRPAVDIKEETDRFVINADVPGVDPKDIEVTMQNGTLTIKGERKTESEEEREGYKRTERSRGTFYRRFSMPDSADAEKVSAKTKNGVLEVVIPKHEVVKPRKISVKG
ncbi:MAG: Hsp20/alpha crystallin family protein [Gammaproteobacteria bacterium]